jgi:hypothetical protein
VVPFVVLTVGILVILTIVVAAVLLAPRLLPRRVTVDDAPDQPQPFGSEMSWLAVKTDDVQRLAAVLGLEIRPANWNSGLGAIYDLELADAFVFITPPVGGWTIVAGVSLPLPAGGAFIDKTGPLLQRLGSQFAQVQYFATFPIIDFYAWARFENGRAVRAFAVGEAGVVWDAGDRTLEEQRLGLSMIEIRGIRNREGDIGGELQLHPTEGQVLSVADGWSINPMAIGSLAADAGVGWVAYAPQTWHAERLSVAA